MRTSCSPAVQGGCGASWALHVYPGKPTIPILCSQDLLLQSPEKALHEGITHMPMQGNAAALPLWLSAMYWRSSLRPAA